MQEVHVHRGFTITVLVEDDPAGGSSITTRIDRTDTDARDVESWTAPRRARSALRGRPAIGEAVDDAQRAIDSALGDPDPLDE
ncbi:hypothetical protein OKW33_006977 [Paraburkholderia atlantica]|uniref:hypothetical protein n=1 Tax=Paraburkholderia atlantica TaxID=2654982 RepID=UPI00128D3482|nr:hypothetical protein [Paraburkholderia atlantica]MPW07829.1 hypothetical protein [Paraburkholderia atlantica]